MENNQKLMDLLEQMEKANRKQVAYARLQFIFSVIAAICCILLLLAGVKVLPQLQEAALQAETVLTNLETVTTELAQADLIGMVENVDALVTNVDGLVGIGHEQGLAVGVHRDELDSLNASFDHAVNRVGATTANAYNLDNCQVVAAGKTAAI